MVTTHIESGPLTFSVRLEFHIFYWILICCQNFLHNGTKQGIVVCQGGLFGSGSWINGIPIRYIWDWPGSLYYIINSIAFDGLTIGGTIASAAVTLNYNSLDIPAAATNGLSDIKTLSWKRNWQEKPALINVTCFKRTFIILIIHFFIFK